VIAALLAQTLAKLVKMTMKKVPWQTLSEVKLLHHFYCCYFCETDLIVAVVGVVDAVDQARY